MSGYVGPSQALSSRMANKADLSDRLDLLLRESAAVREASEELTREVERLRAQIEKHQAKEQRKKPRARGK
jgi:predicted RNA-binding protein with PIN domain